MPRFVHPRLLTPRWTRTTPWKQLSSRADIVVHNYHWPMIESLAKVWCHQDSAGRVPGGPHSGRSKPRTSRPHFGRLRRSDARAITGRSFQHPRARDHSLHCGSSRRTTRRASPGRTLFSDGRCRCGLCTAINLGSEGQEIRKARGPRAGGHDDLPLVGAVSALATHTAANFANRPFPISLPNAKFERKPPLRRFGLALRAVAKPSAALATCEIPEAGILRLPGRRQNAGRPAR